jgi:2-methylisocitrate lyase-like PEP mutase family enzyme
MQHAAAIVASTELPVSIDVENGLLSVGESMLDLAQDLLAAGVAGVNLEDTQDGIISANRCVAPISVAIKSETLEYGGWGWSGDVVEGGLILFFSGECK